jgi:hypothetical protein
MLTIQELHRALGGNILRGKNGPEVLCPGPGHSREDRSLSVTISGGGDDIIVHSFAGDDPIVCKDYVRDKIGLRRGRMVIRGQNAPLQRFTTIPMRADSFYFRLSAMRLRTSGSGGLMGAADGYQISTVCAAFRIACPS